MIPSEIGVGSETLAVTAIGKGALKDAAKAKNIELSASVTTVESGAFEGIPKGTVFNIKATKKQYKSLKKLIGNSGLSTKVKYKRTAPETGK